MISGTFSATSSLLLDDETFKELAIGYVSYCSTMPCDAAPDKIAQDWLEITLEDMDSEDSGISIIFDDAKYTIEWSKTNDRLSALWLTISRVEPQ